jgi:hypothetical protein
MYGFEIMFKASDIEIYSIFYYFLFFYTQYAREIRFAVDCIDVCEGYVFIK